MVSVIPINSSIVISLTLTIPDNEARTAYSTLRRLGLSIGHLERAHLLILAGEHDLKEVEAAVRRNEAVFNENIHELHLAPTVMPAHGELWILDDAPLSVALGQFGYAISLTSWRLLGMAGGPADEATLHEATELLLCNPAVQRRMYHLNELSQEVEKYA